MEYSMTFVKVVDCVLSGFVVVALWVAVVGEILGRGASLDKERLGFWSFATSEDDIDNDDDEDDDDDGTDAEEEDDGGPVYSVKLSSYSNLR